MQRSNLIFGGDVAKAQDYRLSVSTLVFYLIGDDAALWSLVPYVVRGHSCMNGI